MFAITFVDKHKKHLDEIRCNDIFLRFTSFFFSTITIKFHNTGKLNVFFKHKCYLMYKIK